MPSRVLWFRQVVYNVAIDNRHLSMPRKLRIIQHKALLIVGNDGEHHRPKVHINASFYLVQGAQHP